MKYSSEHVWVHQDDSGTALVGISDFAQSELGDIVYVEVPDLGQHVTAGDAVGLIESVKTNSDLFIPVTGTIADINAAVVETPELINASPLEDGWILSISLDDEGELEDLMDESAYLEFVESAA